MKKRILVIDDERLMLYGLKKAFNKDLIEVDTAATAREALQAIRSCNYDLCLIDIRLPDGNGFKLMGPFILEKVRGGNGSIGSAILPDGMSTRF